MVLPCGLDPLLSTELANSTSNLLNLVSKRDIVYSSFLLTALVRLELGRGL
jgi:hypothetical protein